VTRGAHVEQGQNLGAVGMTGWATGPHLHFEVKVGGVQEDPMIMARSAETVELSAAAKTQFLQLAQSMKGQLDAADSMLRSGAYAE
jgi:murein DD-endopeptidase MepM/ murein hydrolase activator NlpD